MANEPKVTWAEVRGVLSRPSFLSLVSIRVVGQVGDGMVQAALTSFVLFSPERQATPLKIAIAFGLLLLPYSVFGPFIGVAIDRWPRQKLLFWVSLLRALSVFLIIAVVRTGDDGWLLGTAVLVSLGIGRFLGATQSASLPHVVRDRELVTGNAFAPTAGTIASATGGMLGVAVSQIAGDNGTISALIISALLQVVAATISTKFHAHELGPDKPAEGWIEQLQRVMHQLTEGWRQLGQHPRALRSLMVVVFHRSAFGMVTVTAIVLMRHAINGFADTDSAIIELAVTVGGAAAGAFIGAAMAPWLAGRWGISRLTSTALMVGATGTAIFLAIVISYPKTVAAVPSMVIAGAFIGWVGQTVKVCGDTVMQESISDLHLGRVFAIYDMAVNVGLFSGILLAALWLPDDGRSLVAIVYLFLILCAALLIVPPSDQRRSRIFR